jgi:aspartyl-tRNA(Asn)/glutamyl-tRNA(Gln) amidotransferase subunit A
MAPPLKDDRLYLVGAALERALQRQWGGALLDQIPELLPRQERVEGEVLAR